MSVTRMLAAGVAALAATCVQPALAAEVDGLTVHSSSVGGTGHFLMMEKPAEFNRVLAEFLDKIDF